MKLEASGVMTPRPPPPKLKLLPDTAPFTPEQRAWLDGFFAAVLGLGEQGSAGLAAQDGAAPTAASPAAGGADEDDGAPWHDLTLPLEERMRLAEGRPLRRRLMAAMGQQDCGQCGYNCRDYAEAIFLKKESRLNLCLPGGKQTLRALKGLCGELGAPPAPVPGTPADPAVGRSRDQPAEAVFVSRTRLNKPGSEKETWHLEIDLSACGLDYEAGDCLGIFPKNDPALADAVIRALAAPPDFPIGGRSLREELIEGVALGTAPDMLFALISYISGGERRHKAKALAAGGDPDGDAAALDVLAAIEKFSPLRPDPEAFVEALEPLQPRLFSISSSPKTDPGRVSLTVETLRYRIGERVRLGVASTYLAERLSPGERLKAYVQSAQHFRLPQDPALPVVMIGPGTGVAPFRAFLHERMATGAPGRNWLFYGHQRRDCDFFYEDEFSGLRAAGVLSRLSLAFSRDGDRKVYVQDRMREVGRDLWDWLADGACVYVCGDAKAMAKDVERALTDIVAQHGARSSDEAAAFVAALKKCGRYRQDVY